MTNPITLDDIRAMLRTPTDIHGYVWDFAIPMVDAIEAKAREDTVYAAWVEEWLAEGGTITLRDEICETFRHADFVLAEQGSILEGKRPYAFNDMWMVIDSTRHRIKCERETANVE